MVQRKFVGNDEIRLEELIRTLEGYSLSVRRRGWSKFSDLNLYSVYFEEFPAEALMGVVNKRVTQFSTENVRSIVGAMRNFVAHYNCRKVYYSPNLSSHISCPHCSPSDYTGGDLTLISKNDRKPELIIGDSNEKCCTYG